MFKKSALSAFGCCIILAAMLAASHWLQAYRPEAAPVFKLTTPLPRFSALEADLLFSGRDNLRQDAATDLAHTLARHFGIELKSGAWNTLALKFSPAAGQKEWIAFAVTVPGSESLLCLLSPQSGRYVLFFARSFHELQQIEKAELTPGADLLWVTESVRGAPERSLWRWDRERGLVEL
ncbi:MAG: hypothetical protein LBL26_01455 [Peptococcaceae bacterium]|jgi:hypothetical protein|nr:hypothetical protein [Peptococcaceae bacterium]